MSNSENKQRRNFWLFLLTFGLMIPIISCFNIWMNSYGILSDKQFKSKVISQDRITKLTWIQEMNPQPEAYVMGSSNSMRMSPDSLAEYTGLTSFNLGMFHATAEDFWCMSNALYDQVETKPKLILFCLDDWNFSKEPSPSDEVFKGAEKRLAYFPVLSKYLDDYSLLKIRWGQLNASLTYDHLLESLKVFKSEWMAEDGFDRVPSSMTEFAFEDGTRKKYLSINMENIDLTDTCETGNFDMGAYLKEVDENWKLYPMTKNGLLDKNHEKFEEFSDRRLQYFERTIALLDRMGCKVIISINPTHPYLKKIIDKETNYPQRMVFLKNYLNELKEKHKNILSIKDNSDIKNFGGYPNHFFDHMHPTSVNSGLMLHTFKEELSSYAF